MNFPEMIAADEAELVHRACQAEGFDDALTEKVRAWHARHADHLDYAERHSDGVGYHVRCLGELGRWQGFVLLIHTSPVMC